MKFNSISPAPYLYGSSGEDISSIDSCEKILTKKPDPSFMKPTANYQKPAKEVNRIKLSKAIERVRQEQIKQSLIKNSNVSIVAESLITDLQYRDDKEFK